jgi:hypothetical protein
MFIGISQTGLFQLDPFELVVMVMIKSGGSAVGVIDVLVDVGYNISLNRCMELSWWESCKWESLSHIFFGWDGVLVSSGWSWVSNAFYV